MTRNHYIALAIGFAVGYIMTEKAVNTVPQLGQAFNFGASLR